MKSWDFLTVDVFADQAFGGNPLAVFPDGEGLTDMQMQNIAREFNLSETTFVLPPKNPSHTAAVRIFAPQSELPFAGHPNIGTAWVLATQRPDLGREIVFEESAGLVHIEILRTAEGVPIGATLTAPQPLAVGRTLPVDLIASCVGLAQSEIAIDRHLPQMAGVGISMTMMELKHAASLRSARAVSARFDEAQTKFPELGGNFQLHLYVRDPGDRDRLDTRMFAPLLGIVEDPATGSANAALAAFLLSLDIDCPSRSFTITQGIVMGRPSLLHASAERRKDGEIWAQVGGNCVAMMRGSIDL